MYQSNRKVCGLATTVTIDIEGFLQSFMPFLIQDCAAYMLQFTVFKWWLKNQSFNLFLYQNIYNTGKHQIATVEIGTKVW